MTSTAKKKFSRHFFSVFDLKLYDSYFANLPCIIVNGYSNDKYILLDILVCSTFTSHAVFWRARRANQITNDYQEFTAILHTKCLIRDLLSNVFVSPKILTCQGF